MARIGGGRSVCFCISCIQCLLLWWRWRWCCWWMRCGWGREGATKVEMTMPSLSVPSAPKHMPKPRRGVMSARPPPPSDNKPHQKFGFFDTKPHRQISPSSPQSPSDVVQPEEIRQAKKQNIRLLNTYKNKLACRTLRCPRRASRPSSCAVLELH